MGTAKNQKMANVGKSSLFARQRRNPPKSEARVRKVKVSILEVQWLHTDDPRIASCSWKVAEPARAPDVGKVVLDEEVLDQLVLGGGLEGDEVHAVLPADVPSVQPVNFVVGEVFFVTREPVAVSAVLKMLWPLGTFDRVRQ